MSGISVLLAVDDNPDNLFVLEQLIAQYCPECRILKAVNADMGLEIARSRMPDVALVDVQMPGMDGIEMCRRLKADPETARIPVILLTAHQTTSSRKVMGLEAGADDFITKPVDSIELIARINVMRRIRAAEDELRREKNSLTKTVSRQFTQLKDAEKDYYALFNSASDAFFIQDMDGRFLEVNDEAVNRLGYSREQFSRMFPKDINPPESADHFSERTKQLLEKGQIIFETFHLPRNASPIPTEVSARFIEYRGRQAILSIARDIRERKQAEAERERLQYQLQQAQKHQALGTLAGGIAHDFNNILAPIIGYAEMGLAEVSEESPLHRNMVEILRAAERASKLVGQILIFSRSDSQERKPIHVQIVIREALKLIRATIPSAIRIHEQIDETCGAVLADSTQTHQIIMNLCTNAWHAMEDGGGEIRISLSEVFIGPGSHIERLSRSPGRYLRLIVSDTGHGMTPAVRERIFDPYFTTKEKGKGTGLGLAVVQGIVHSYDGEITVFSRPGIGTTFSIYLPRFESKTEPVTDEIVQTGTPPCGNERILLVDDEEQVAVIECQLLESLGYQVTAMTSSQDALSLFRKQPEAFDLVITDHAMPGMGGIELAGKIIAIRQEMPVLLCTGFGDMATVEKSKTAGVRAFMKKPVSRKELAISVRNILDGMETLHA